MDRTYDVVVIGAGIAGLAAARRCAEKGLKVVILEGRHRTGGRILTLQDSQASHAVELGAEFVHGKTPDVFSLIEEAELTALPSEGEDWCWADGRLGKCEFFEQVDDVVSRTTDYEGPDISFEQFLRAQGDVDERARGAARSYVAGFHGAPPSDIGVRAIALDTRAEENAGGADESFRISGGYSRLLAHLQAKCAESGVEVCLSHTVRHIEWAPLSVRIASRTPHGEVEHRAARAIITVPPTILMGDGAAGITITPELPSKRAALQGIALGGVLRVTLVLSERFWCEVLSEDLGFLFTQKAPFPTWWTLYPDTAPILTAWSPATMSQTLQGKSAQELGELALHELAAVLDMPYRDLAPKLVRAYSHDWLSDPYSLGSYSYARVGGVESFARLAEPVGNTLFFAGEATESTGHHATVHGALMSGERAAREVLSHTT